jgi:hypothetical protein
MGRMSRMDSTITHRTATGRGTVREEFASKRRRQIVAAVSLIGVLLLMIVFVEVKTVPFPGIATAVWLLILLEFILLGGLFSLSNWRCPACNKYLGKSISPKSCGSCGVHLS